MNKKKIFLDACALMDFFADRKNADAIEAVLALAETDKLDCFTSSNVICTLAYLFERHKVLPNKEIPKAIASICDIVQVLSVGQKEIDWAVGNSAGDFEDAVECACADTVCDIIITDNVKDFKISKIQVVTPDTFMTLFL